MRPHGALLVYLFCILPAAVLGQSTFGTIRGQLTDKTGAVVPSAKIVITHQAENSSREVSGDGQGNFEAVNLKAGSYSVSAEATGFKAVQKRDLILDARQILRVDLELEVGQVSEQVTVEGTAAVISPETQTVSTSFDNKQVLSLPANFRGDRSTSPLGLIAFLPGVQTDNADGGRFGVQGALPHQTEVSLDGISTVSVRTNGPQKELFPSVEGIAEIRVQGVGNNAEFGQVGDITTTSKGGGNDFHGSLFEYMQNRVFDAATYGSPSKPQKTANTFGGSLGGRILRNKTFFFTAYEGMRFRSGGTIQNHVPTQSMRDGDFSREPSVIRDPLNSNQPYANNRIPATQLSPVAQRILKYYPLPNFGRTDVLTNANFRENRANPITSDQYDVRIDHILSAKQGLFVRWSSKDQNQVGLNNLLLPSDDVVTDSRSLVVSHNAALSAAMLNEFRLGLANYDLVQQYNFDGAKITGEFGFQGLPSTFPFNGITAIGFDRGSITNFGKPKQQFVYSRNIQFNDNLTWTRGRHTMKFGGDFRRLRAESNLSFLASDDYGSFRFNSAYAGNEFAEFLIGLPYYAGISTTGKDTDGLSWHYAFYAQDNFRVNRKLTLEFGVRWEYHPPFTDAAFNITNFDRNVPVTGRVIIPSDPQSKQLTAPGFLTSINACPGPTVNGVPCTPLLTASEAGWPETLRFADKNNFNPRFGFAYRPFSDSKTVVRGGFGIYTMTLLGSVFYSLTGIHGSDVRIYGNRITNNQPAFRWPAVSTGGSAFQTALGNQDFRTANHERLRDPYSMQWNLTVEREIGPVTGIRLSYIGLRSVNLPYSPDINQMQPAALRAAQRPLTDRPFPNWNIIFSRDHGANSIYSAAQAEFTRRTRSGLTLSTAWTWAKNLSDAGGPNPNGFSAENGGGRLTNSLDRRSDRGDVASTRRHRWITTSVYDLPLGKGKKFLAGAHPVVDAIAGGWRLSGILLFQTGPFLTAVMSGGDPSGTNTPLRSSVARPDALINGNLDNPTPGLWWNRDAFLCPGRQPGAADRFACGVTPIGRFGNSGVGTLTGPGTVNLSLGLAKDFRVTEASRIRFEASFTNLPNHPNFSDPQTNISNPAFGRTTSTKSAEGGGNRVGQFALRFEF